jgi:hypothetical protein
MPNFFFCLLSSSYPRVGSLTVGNMKKENIEYVMHRQNYDGHGGDYS